PQGPVVVAEAERARPQGTHALDRAAVLIGVEDQRHAADATAAAEDRVARDRDALALPDEGAAAEGVAGRVDDPELEAAPEVDEGEAVALEEVELGVAAVAPVAADLGQLAMEFDVGMGGHLRLPCGPGSRSTCHRADGAGRGRTHGARAGRPGRGRRSACRSR